MSKAANGLRVSVICVPYQTDIGRWTTARGPEAYLRAGLVEQLRTRGHEVDGPTWIELHNSERTRDSVANLGRIASKTSDAVSSALKHEDGFVVGLVGDCTHAVGILGGFERATGRPPGVAWFDAHGDINTLTNSPTGYLGGVPLGVALGWDFPDWRTAAGLACPIDLKSTALIGTSDLDPGEKDALAKNPSILHITATELSAPDAIAELAQNMRLRSRNASEWLVHLDVDVAGRNEVPGCMSPTESAPPRGALVAAAAAIAGNAPVKGVSAACYNPAGDIDGGGVSFGIEVMLAVIDRVSASRLMTPIVVGSGGSN